MRCLLDGRAVSRSTTTSMVCRSCRLSSGGSLSRYSVPSTRTRANPLDCRSVNSLAYSPLRSRATGASTWNRVPSGSARIRSTICWGVCFVIGSPQTGQCGWPIRAQSRRR